MQKAIIHYFSGTGNSLLAAKQLTGELTKYNYDLDLHSIEDGIYDNSKLYSLHIFFFPVYATAVPHIMRKYINNLPNGNKVRTAVISTNGRVSTHIRDGYQGWALHQARLYLKRKNYDVFFSDTLDYPHNVTIAFPPRSEKYNQIIISKALENLVKMAQRIVDNHTYHRSYFYPNFIWSLPFGILYTLIGRRCIALLFAADSSCDNCKICMIKCPVKAINANHKVNRWRLNCEGCLRCINICPHKSIQISAVRFAALIWAVTANPLRILYQFIPDQYFNGLGSRGASTFRYIFDALLILIFLIILDRIIYLLSYIPICKKVIGFGHTGFFGRYHAKPYENIFLKKRK